MSDYSTSNQAPFDAQPKDEKVDRKLKDRRAVDLVRSFVRKSKEYREPHLDLARRCRERYVNWELEEKSKIRRANLKPAYGFVIIETLLPQVCSLFLNDNYIVKLQGQEPQDVLYENSLTDFYGIQFRDMDFAAKFPSFVKNMLLDGTAVAKVPYRYEEAMRIRRERQADPETGAVTRTKTAYPEVTYDGPDFEVIPLYDFFPDWRMKEPGNVQKMRGCVHQFTRSLAELRRLAKKTAPDGSSVGIYKNLDELEYSKKARGCDAWAPPYWSDRHKEEGERLDSNKAHQKDQDSITCWEYWGLYDATGNGDFQEFVITVANGDVLIREDENFFDCQFKPFVASPNYLRSNEFYGIPEIIATDSEIREATAIRNARLDQINLGVNTMWLVERNGGIDTRNLYSRPNGIIYTNDINALKPLPPSDPSTSSAQELQQIELGISQATAIGSPPTTASASALGRTARGVEYMSSFSSSRLGLKALLVSEIMLKPMVGIMHKMNSQFVTDEVWVRSSNPDSENPFDALDPSAFYRNFDFIIKTKPDLPDSVETEKIQAVAQIAQVAEATQPGSIKMDVLLESMLRPIVGPQAKKFMRTPEEMAAMKQENMMMELQKQAANAQIGAMAPQPNSTPTGGSGGI